MGYGPMIGRVVIVVDAMQTSQVIYAITSGCAPCMCSRPSALHRSGSTRRARLCPEQWQCSTGNGRTSVLASAEKFLRQKISWTIHRIRAKHIRAYYGIFKMDSIDFTIRSGAFPAEIRR